MCLTMHLRVRFSPKYHGKNLQLPYLNLYTIFGFNNDLKQTRTLNTFYISVQINPLSHAYSKFLVSPLQFSSARWLQCGHCVKCPMEVWINKCAAVLVPQEEIFSILKNKQKI